MPKEWIAPPDFDTADGELLDEDEHEHGRSNETSRMLSDTDTSHRRRSLDATLMDGDVRYDEWSSDEERRQGGSGKGKYPVRDTSGRVVPLSERAPTR